MRTCSRWPYAFHIAEAQAFIDGNKRILFQR
jgi:hypothetical protein